MTYSPPRNEGKQYGRQIHPFSFNVFVYSRILQKSQGLSRVGLLFNFNLQYRSISTSSPGRFSLALEVGPNSKAREKHPGDDVGLIYATFNKLLAQFSFSFENGIIITQRQYSVKNCWEKQQKLANLWQKRYFKNELKHSKRFDHVTDDVMSLFWSWKNYQVEHYFPANFLCRVIKGWLYSPRPSLPTFSLMSITPIKF